MVNPLQSNLFSKLNFGESQTQAGSSLNSTFLFDYRAGDNQTKQAVEYSVWLGGLNNGGILCRRQSYFLCRCENVVLLHDLSA